MPGQERSTLNPPAERSRGALIALLVALALAAGAGWWWWQRQAAPAAPLPAAVSRAPTDVTPAPAVEPDTGPQNPIEALAEEPDTELPALAGADDYVAKALAELLGQRQVAAFLQVDGIVRRVVATVDNLARSHAPASVWPVQAVPERFMVQGAGSAHTIALDNAARYSTLVQWIEGVDLKRAVALYARLYPLFQQTYEELGYPGRYFNDRLVAVIDHLLQAPEPEGPVQVKLTEVKGEVASTRPWVRYEYVDPQLEALSSGQKIMVRVGLVNERRLKARLTALRPLVATGEVAKAKP